MIFQLVRRSVEQHPGRSLLLLLGYALGVGVTIALLSIGGAMVEQSRDQALIGGGDLVVLPEGIDLETLRTGGVSSMFFSVEQAPFLYREVLSSERFRDRIAGAAPWITDELLYLGEDELVPVSAGGLIPSRAEALGVSPALVEGTWTDSPADRQWLAPGERALYASLDGLHLPTGEARGDSTWAEWHYFNVLLPDDEGWLYLTYMIAGEIPDGTWGGRMLGTVVRPGSGELAYESLEDPQAVRFEAGEPDLSIGPSAVSIDDDGRYRLTAAVPAIGGSDTLRVSLSVSARTRRYVPPIDIGGGRLNSGYAVPILDGVATGELCFDSICTALDDAKTYHDHNWGVWRDVTWNWGQATAGDWSLLYGGVTQSDGAAGARFLYLADSTGFGGIVPIRDVVVSWDESEPRRPTDVSVWAVRGSDSIHVRAAVDHWRATDLPVSDGPGARFFQLRGPFQLEGTLGGEVLEESGEGFFETWSRSPGD